MPFYSGFDGSFTYGPQSLHLDGHNEAITEADYDKVEALVDAGADILFRDPNDNEALLHNAAITADDN